METLVIPIPLHYIGAMQVATDSVTSFLTDRADVRGRLVRLGPLADTVLGRYDYPPAIARLLGELLLVAAMLGSNLKQQGIFTIQIRGGGLIKLLVVDAVFGGQLRGFAEMTDDNRAAVHALGENASLRQLFGDDAYFAITLDPGAGMQRYQGVVGLEGETVTQALTHYFTHSQQVDVLFKLALARVDGNWVAGGIMIERLPEASAGASPHTAASRPISTPTTVTPAKAGAHDGGLERAEVMDCLNNDPETGSLPSVESGLRRDDEIKDALIQEVGDESWRYATAITSTVKETELTDPMLDAPALLYRLYHEEGVWVEPSHPLATGCRCSRQRIEDLLLSMPATDRADMVVDGAASVHCQFCNTTEKFTPEELGLSVQ